MNVVIEKRADWLTSRPVEAACFPDDEPAPCSACVARGGPADLSDAGWDDATRWTITPDDEVDPRTWDATLDAEAARIGARLQAACF